MSTYASYGRQKKGACNEYEGEEELMAPPWCNAIYCQKEDPGLVCDWE